MRWILTTILAITCSVASADDLMVFRLKGGANVAVKNSGGAMELVGVFDSVTVVGDAPTPPQPPVNDQPTGPGQLICVRPWSLSLDESDADLTIRESLDAVQSKIPYFSLLPGTPDEQLQPHPAEAYRSLVKDKTKGWVFHVVPTKTTPRILEQGPLDEDVVLKWIGIAKVQFAADNANEQRWLDVDFSRQQGELLGALELPERMRAAAIAAAQNVRTLPGFRPIPKAEWAQWTARFPITRLAKSVRNITEQTMGSCVGHACANGVEAGEYALAGDMFFRRISGMSMYKRIGRSANSGAYITDAAEEIFTRGILPVTGEPYPHTFAQDTGWSTPMPSGWEQTGKLWKSIVYSVDDEEAGFAIGMDARLRRQIGRSSHSISAGGYTGKNWWYENSWGTDWGDLGKSIGYDSKFYSGFVYQPVLRSEIQVLMARELPQMARRPSRQSDAEQFRETIEDIKRQAGVSDW